VEPGITGPFLLESFSWLGLRYRLRVGCDTTVGLIFAWVACRPGVERRLRRFNLNNICPGELRPPQVLRAALINASVRSSNQLSLSERKFEKMKVLLTPTAIVKLCVFCLFLGVLASLLL
jgi:hypothetical protein